MRRRETRRRPLDRLGLPRGKPSRLGAAALALGVVLAAAGATPTRALPGGARAMAARMLAEETASEHWDLTARFESGHGLFVRAMVTNAGPGRNTAVVTGQVVFPDGQVYPFDNGRREGRWSVSSDGLALKIGGSRLDLRGEWHGFSKQSKKQGIQLEMRFPARVPVLGPDAGEPGVAALAIAPIDGRFQVGEMPAPLEVEGVVFLRHAWGRAPEGELSRRWIDVVAGDADDGAVFWGLEMPSGERRQWLSVRRAGAPGLETHAVRFEPIGGLGPEAAYPIPRRVALRGEGVEGTLELGRELVRFDPLLGIPQPFRWWIEREIAPRRILAEARLRLRAGSDRAALDAPALVGVTWTNPLP